MSDTNLANLESAVALQSDAQAIQPLKLGDSKSVLLDQAYVDFCRRRDDGEAVDPDEYCARFPAMKSTLGRLLQAHLFLEENSGLLADSPEIHWPEAGETFLDYQLLLELGKGAFARVFLATEPKLGNRLVAVKVALHGGAEAEVLGRIKHPNIVPVYSAPEDSATGLTAVCMPYVGSATLCDVLDRAFQKSPSPESARVILDAASEIPYPLDPSAHPASPAPVLLKGSYIDGIRLIGARLADALAFIHDRGIYHRDLKPSNVLLSPDGVPMLLDFNLCADANAALNRLGGTMPYMSPEQLRATEPDGLFDSASLDGRSDIFSLGVILYQLVTGTHPYGPIPLKLSTDELRRHLRKRQQAGAVEACRVNPRVDVAFSRLIQRCLAQDPKLRPQTAREVSSELHRALAPLPRTRRWLDRHPRKAIAAAVMLVALCFAGIAFAATRSPYHQRQIDTGRELYQQGKYTAALPYFKEALQADPNRSDAYFALARAYQQLGPTEKSNYSSAFQNYLEAFQRNPDGRYKAGMAYCANRTSQHRDAEELYRQAIQSGFATAEVYNNLGYCCFKSKKANEAVEHVDRAIQLNPDMQAAYHNRVVLALDKVMPMVGSLGKQGDEKLQREVYRILEVGIGDGQKALTLGPASAELCYDLACLEALAARVDNRWIPTALDHLEVSIKHGVDPKKIALDPLLGSLRQEARFQKLASADKNAVPIPPTLRLVDPINDLTP